MFKAAIAKLDDELYDATPANFHDFMNSFGDRANASGWEPTLMVEVQGVDVRLDHQYGSVSMEAAKHHVESYFDTESRDAHNDFLIYHCLKSSLNRSARNRVGTKKSNFCICNKPSRILYLKALTQTVQVDTCSTESHMLTPLSTLDELMSECKDNIHLFNEKVQAHMDSLAARNKMDHHLMKHLWKGHRACRDKEFKNLIKFKHCDWKHNADIDEQSIMEFTNNEYFSRVENGAWMEEIEEAQHVVALAAQVARLNKKLTKASSDKTADKRGTGNKKRRAMPPWKRVPPKSGEGTSKKVDGSSYHWCPHHQEAGM